MFYHLLFLQSSISSNAFMLFYQESLLLDSNVTTFCNLFTNRWNSFVLLGISAVKFKQSLSFKCYVLQLFID